MLLLTPIAAAWVPLVTAWIAVMYVVGRLVLGRWPHTWGMDDPLGIHIVREMRVIAGLGMLLTPLMIPVGVVALLFLIARQPRRGAMVVAGVVAAWVLALGLGGPVWRWFMD